MPLLVGTDGVEKMSKSYNNYIGISDTAQDIFGKTLSIADNMIYTYYELASDVSNDELISVKTKLADPGINPRDIKRALARTFVRMYHSEEAAVQAQEEFDKIFIKKEIPDEIEEVSLSGEIKEISLLDLILKVNFAPSKGEARRLVQQGGVTVNGEKVDDIAAIIKLDGEIILKVGKRKFVKIK
jgi:tyrosyl-tRNA synthetase